MHINESILTTMANDIARAANADRVILFGSHARGDASAHSDVDLLIVVPGKFGADRSRRRLTTDLSRSLAHYRIPNDLLVYTSDEVEKWQHEQNHLIARGLAEGRVLYERH